ncbi:hypothetical protein PFISCL1PPCAC_17510, partial [Pristionchus fissidentatus]
FRLIFDLSDDGRKHLLALRRLLRETFAPPLAVPHPCAHRHVRVLPYPSSSSVADFPREEEGADEGDAHDGTDDEKETTTTA